MREKFAVNDRASVIETVVLAELELETPVPDHPVKSYPVSGVAAMVGFVPWSNDPAPDTVPPEPAVRERV